jgi:hypothetical protein
MKKNKNQEVIDESSIITLYMEEVLENGKEPLNVFSFCKNHSIEETNFYQYFGSFKAIKERIWVKFLENVIHIINENKEFSNYSDKDKLLTFYFSLFEIYTLNRSYIIQTLETENNPLKSVEQLKEFRKQFKKFIDNNIESPIKNEKVSNFTSPVISEGAWVQFLFILKFWLDDTSTNFEKTDILIEKSITTSSLLMDSKPLESLFDLAKFLFKEKM